MKKNLILSITSISSVLAAIPLTTISCGNTVSNSEADIIDPIVPPVEDNNPSQPGVDGTNPELPPVVNPDQPSKPGTDVTDPELPPVVNPDQPSQPGVDGTNPELPPVVNPDQPSKPGTDESKPELPPVVNPDQPSKPGTDESKPELPPVDEPEQPSLPENLPIRVVTRYIVQCNDRFEVWIEGDNLIQDSSYYIFTNDNYGTKYMNLDTTKTNSSRIVLYTEDFTFQNQDWKLEVKDHESNLYDAGILKFPNMLVVNNISNYVQYLYNGVINYNKSLAKNMSSYQDYLEIYNWLRNYKNSNVKVNNNISIVTDRIEVNYNNLSNNSSTFEYSLYFSVYYKIVQNNNVLRSFNYVYNNPGPINDPMLHREYVTEDGIVIKDNKIVDYRGTSETVVIKDKYVIQADYGKVVTGIITEISDSAFENKGIRHITLSSSISKIGNKAFKDNNIVSISFPSSVKEIGVSCFEGNLLSILDLRNANINHISDYAFAHNWITTLEWGLSVHSIGVGCFQNNLLTKVDLRPTRVKTISDFAFYHNVISELSWNSSVANVGESAFERNQLRSVDFLKANIRVVGKAAFKDNWITSLETLSLNEIGDSAFENNKIKSIDFSRSYNLTTIGTACFKNNLITSIIWNQKIEKVSREAFMYNKLRNDGLNLVNSKINCIDAWAFAYNDLSYNLWNRSPRNIIHLPETIKLIGYGAFQSNEVYITKMDDGFVEVLDCNIFDIAGDADRFWNQVSIIRVVSPDWITYPSALEHKEQWIMYMFNAFIIDTNGVADYGSL